jgi:hypothetical protein
MLNGALGRANREKRYLSSPMVCGSRWGLKENATAKRTSSMRPDIDDDRFFA